MNNKIAMKINNVMKKTVIFLGFVLVLCLPLTAQDTVHIRDMRQISKYYVPVWPHHLPTITDPKGVEYIQGYISKLGENYQQLKEDAEGMYTDDTLQVYGIAASLSTYWRLNPDYYAEDIRAGRLDTSCEYLYTYLRLYEADPDSLRHIGEEMLVNLRYTPVSYYIDMDLFSHFEGNAAEYTVHFQPILPMYERYFSEPVTVADSFYVGRRFRTEHQNGEVRLIYFADTSYYGTRHEASYEDYIWTNMFGEVDTAKGWCYATWGVRREIPFLFPIIAPPDTTANPSDTTVINPIDTVINLGDTIIVLPGDTLIIGGDTLVNTGDTVIVTPGEPIIIGGDTIVVNPGDSVIVNPGSHLAIIRQDDLIYRYTSLQPNPASDRVSVLSSFGITAIEAYDLRGRLVKKFSIPNSQLSINLDVSSWPRGTYLLRITTSNGITTKKLLIQ